MERSFGPDSLGISGFVTMAAMSSGHGSELPVGGGALRLGWPWSHPCPTLTASSSKGSSPKEGPADQGHPFSGAHKWLIN